MLILIPWKPVVLLVGFMAALVLVGYFVPFLLEGKNPFADDWNHMQRIVAKQTAAHAAPQPTHTHSRSCNRPVRL